MSKDPYEGTLENGHATASTRRLRLNAWGCVQGVGFRPFVYRLAREMGIVGSVSNSAQGATIEIQGEEGGLAQFEHRLRTELPSPAYLAGLESIRLAPQICDRFEILESERTGPVTATILPDIATCPKCLEEISDPSNRRYRYPFTNCTHCGPRYSIISGLPYDRPNTSMAGFNMCPDCLAEYRDPADRRFHAQPIACPVCGPHLELWDPDGWVVSRFDEALTGAAAAIRSGQIVAVKGIGGFHLVVRADDEEAVVRLRARKHRESKPMAVMVPTIEVARRLAKLSPDEERALTGPECPIVIVTSQKSGLAPSVAPANPNVGLMLPYSPIHHLLLEAIGVPLVATSGNLSEEPICINEREALIRFSNLADLLLVHNRPILRPVDDSIVRVMPQGTMAMRRARGYAPLPFPLAEAKPGLLAMGAHVKSSIAVSLSGSIVVGQHIGDLDNADTRTRLEDEARDIPNLFELQVDAIAHDLHPDYASTLMARESGLPLTAVQHHLAHAVACIVENELSGPVLAVSWDGTGYGTDGSVWGGEFFTVDGSEARRIGHLRPFFLPGGEIAAHEGWRSAYGALFAALGKEGLTVAQILLMDSDPRIVQLLQSGARCVSTTSAGRLFDAAAALGAGFVRSRFEGDAAMRFEGISEGISADPYPIEIHRTGDTVELDWGPALVAMAQSSEPLGVRSARFHEALSEGVLLVAQELGFEQVVLTGGCFQNRRLTLGVWNRLKHAGFTPYGHRRIPPNDGGIAFGQAVAVTRKIRLLT